MELPCQSRPGSGAPPSRLPTHIPHDALVHWLHEEGGAETPLRYITSGMVAMNLCGVERAQTSGLAQQAQGPLSQPVRPAHLGQVEGVGGAWLCMRLGQVHNKPRAHVQQANLGTHGAWGQGAGVPSQDEVTLQLATQQLAPDH